MDTLRRTDRRLRYLERVLMGLAVCLGFVQVFQPGVLPMMVAFALVCLVILAFHDVARWRKKYLDLLEQFEALERQVTQTAKATGQGGAP